MATEVPSFAAFFGAVWPDKKDVRGVQPADITASLAVIEEDDSLDSQCLLELTADSGTVTSDTNLYTSDGGYVPFTVDP